MQAPPHVKQRWHRRLTPKRANSPTLGRRTSPARDESFLIGRFRIGSLPSTRTLPIRQVCLLTMSALLAPFISGSTRARLKLAANVPGDWASGFVRASGTPTSYDGVNRRPGGRRDDLPFGYGAKWGLDTRWVSGLGITPGHWAHREPAPHGEPGRLVGTLFGWGRRQDPSCTGRPSHPCADEDEQNAEGHGDGDRPLRHELWRPDSDERQAHIHQHLASALSANWSFPVSAPVPACTRYRPPQEVPGERSRISRFCRAMAGC
jgi:hypothetical protein